MKATLHTVERDGAGRLSTMAKPRGGDWLEDEMRALVLAGVDVLVSALGPDEERELDLVEEAAAARAAGIAYVALPIPDRAVPRHEDVEPVLRRLAGDLQAGRHVVVHCRYGIGRASLVAAALMVLEGGDPDDVWRRIEQARGVAVPDTDEQREWVRRVAPA